MNRHFRNETHHRNERMQLEMNQQEEDNMNQEFTDKELINKVQQIEDTEIRETILDIINGDDMMNNLIDIDGIKTYVQKGYKKYIYALKFVTYEDADTVLFTIKKDLREYDVAKLYVRNSMIEVILESNATLCVYYFLNSGVYQEVIDALKELDVSVQIHND